MKGAEGSRSCTAHFAYLCMRAPHVWQAHACSEEPCSLARGAGMRCVAVTNLPARPRSCGGLPCSRSAHSPGPHSWPACCRPCLPWRTQSIFTSSLCRVFMHATPQTWHPYRLSGFVWTTLDCRLMAVSSHTAVCTCTAWHYVETPKLTTAGIINVLPSAGLLCSRWLAIGFPHLVLYTIADMASTALDRWAHMALPA